MEKHTKEFEWNGKSEQNNIVMFEIQIPEKAKRSYSARYSEHYWWLWTKLDVAGGSDMHAKRIIHVA
jgi:hypothetical protein